MANNKPISDATAFPLETNVRLISGLAGYKAGNPNTNTKIEGTALVQSVINSANSGVDKRVTFYAASGNTVELAGSDGFTWSNDNTNTLSIGNIGNFAGNIVINSSSNLATPVEGVLSFVSRTGDTFGIYAGTTLSDQRWALPGTMPPAGGYSVLAGVPSVPGNDVGLSWVTRLEYTLETTQSAAGNNNDPEITLTDNETTPVTSSIKLVGGFNNSITRNTTGDEITIDVVPAGVTGQIQFNSANRLEADATLFYTIANNTGTLGVGDVGVTQGRFNVYGGANNSSGTIGITDSNDEGVTLTVPTMVTSYDITFPDDEPGANNKILESDSSGNLSWIDTPTSGGGATAFTNLTAGDVVKWDYSVDGPNIELITTQDPDPAITRDNVITMWDNSTNTASDIASIPDGATGTLIVHPTANPYFNFPTGSKLSDASNIRLDGTIKVLRWVKEGNGADPTLSPTANNYGCLYWAGFENFADAATIPGPDIDAAITSNLYGWWDPDDYTGAVQGTGVSNLGVVNNSTVPSKVLGGASTGNSLTINNSETTIGDAWEQIELIDSTNNNPTYFKWTSDSFPNFAFDNSTVAPAQNKYTVMIWFKVDSGQSDTSDLGLFDASLNLVNGQPVDDGEDSGYQVTSINSDSGRRLQFRVRSNTPDIYESLYQNWADDEWCCLILSVDPTVPQIRHLFGNQYTSTNAGDNITGSGIVSGNNTIAVNANGTYIDFLYEDGDTGLPSDGTDPSSNLTANQIIEQFIGFRYGEGRRPDFSTFDFQGSFGILGLWDGEAKSDSDMQTIYDYLKGYFGIT